MKYLQTIDLNAGVDTDITTTLTTEPYSVLLLDENAVTGEWDDITYSVQIAIALVGLVYHVYIYSFDALTSIKLKIIY